MLCLTDDSFLCDTCPRPTSPMSDSDRFEQHFNTHPLVRCKVRVEDARELSEFERFVVLDRRSNEADKKLDGLGIDLHDLDTKVGVVDVKVLNLEERVGQILRYLSNPTKHSDA